MGGSGWVRKCGGGGIRVACQGAVVGDVVVTALLRGRATTSLPGSTSGKSY